MNDTNQVLGRDMLLTKVQLWLRDHRAIGIPPNFTRIRHLAQRDEIGVGFVEARLLGDAVNRIGEQRRGICFTLAPARFAAISSSIKPPRGPILYCIQWHIRQIRITAAILSTAPEQNTLPLRSRQSWDAGIVHNLR